MYNWHFGGVNKGGGMGEGVVDYGDQGRVHNVRTLKRGEGVHKGGDSEIIFQLPWAEK